MTTTTTTTKKNTITNLINLAKKVEQFKTTEEYTKWLEFNGKFYNYSFHNICLIISQRPTASRVATYKTWQKLGRQVKKGEKGIGILVPIWKRNEKETTEEYNKRKNNSSTSFFITGYVFDISQTEGEEIPSLSLHIEESEKATDELWEKLCNITPYEVTRVEIQKEGCRGWCDYLTRTIGVKQELDKTNATSTLIHEVAHSLFEEHDNFTKEENELVADSVAYSVLNALGIDSEAKNVKYLATWGANLEKLTKLAPQIAQITKTILNGLNEEASED